MTRIRLRPTPSAQSVPGSHHLRRSLLVGLLAVAAIAPAAVAQESEVIESPVPGAVAAPVYPVTFIDDEGTTVVIPAFPERLISLSPAITESVFALGAGDRLVGGTDYDDFPAAAVELPDVATFSGVLMEQVVAQQPDLILAAGNGFTPADDIARLRELGFNVAVFYAETHEEVLGALRRLGVAIGASQEAYLLTDRIAADLDRVADALTMVTTRPRTFYQIGSEPEIYAPAPGSFLADLIDLAGGDPIVTEDPAVYSISEERILAADPEVIIVADAVWGVCPADVAARPGWGGLSAVVNGAVRPVDDTTITRPGPRIAEGFAQLARAIHPDLAISGFRPDPVLCATAGTVRAG